MDLEDPGKDDFELWSPSEEREERCLFGKQVSMIFRFVESSTNPFFTRHFIIVVYEIKIVLLEINLKHRKDWSSTVLASSPILNGAFTNISVFCYVLSEIFYC